MHSYKIESRRYHTCESKKRYRTEKDVMIAVKKCKINYGVDYEYYDCPYCRGFHLTSE